jgi:hypothetical protein
VLIRSASRRHKVPLRAAYFRQVLPLVPGFPTLRVLRSIRLPIGIRRAFPFTVLLRLPIRLSSLTLRFPLNSVPGFPLPCLSVDIPYLRPSHRQERLGPPKFFDVSLASHARAFRLRRTSTPSPIRASRVGFRFVKTFALRNKLISKLYQHKGERGLPYGLQDSLSTLRLSCSPPPRLRHRRKTRYGWVASPYPTGTLTRKAPPSFSWRDND